LEPVLAAQVAPHLALVVEQGTAYWRSLHWARQTSRPWRGEWDDFGVMRAVGIDTVIIIRCAWRRWLTIPRPSCPRMSYYPPVTDSRHVPEA